MTQSNYLACVMLTSVKTSLNYAWAKCLSTLYGNGILDLEVKYIENTLMAGIWLVPWRMNCPPCFKTWKIAWRRRWTPFCGTSLVTQHTYRKPNLHINKRKTYKFPSTQHYNIDFLHKTVSWFQESSWMSQNIFSLTRGLFASSPSNAIFRRLRKLSLINCFPSRLSESKWWSRSGSVAGFHTMSSIPFTIPWNFGSAWIVVCKPSPP